MTIIFFNNYKNIYLIPLRYKNKSNTKLLLVYQRDGYSIEIDKQKVIR